MVRALMIMALLGLSWAFNFAHGDQVPSHEKETTNALELTPPLEVYEDKSGSETIETVQSKTFHPSKQAVPNFGFTRAAYWFKLSASNPTSKPLVLYLRIVNQWLDYIDIFVSSDRTSRFEHFRSGALVPWDERMPGRGGPVLRIKLDPQETKVIYVRAQSQTPVRVPIFLSSREAYHRSQLETIFVLGVFCGILVFLIVYNLLAWSILKQSAYLYYILMLVGIGIHQIGWDDLVPHVSFFDHPGTMLHLFTSSLALVCISNVLFVQSFMDARRKYPICYRILDLVLIGGVVLAILYVFNWYVGNHYAFIYVQFLSLALALTLGWMRYKGETHARYVFLAHVQFPLVAIATVGFTSGFLPYNPILAQVIKLGYILQGIFFSLALADRFAALQRNFQQILEGTVAERSAELVTANQELQSEVSERKRTEEELRKAKEAAEAATIAKGEFLANMSHEIRTPLNAVLGMIGLMLDSDMTNRQRERARVIKSAADSLLALLNDVLDLSKIEAGKLDLAETDFSVKCILASAESLLAVRANDKMLKLSYAIGEMVPDRLRGDPNRLRQILLNLGNNAVKFTDQGEISMRVEAQDQPDGEVVLHFEVSDTGVGIPQDKLELIFERFSQADSSTTKKYGGTGLGLAISSQLATAMGGNMWVESELGKGSTFHFTAPFRRVGEPQEFDPTSTQHIMATTDLRGTKVLLVEDNIFNQAVALETLKRWGCDVTVASNGREAVEAFDSQRFDVILMDLQMPEMDGFEATRIIRSKEIAERVPIIAQTAHAFAEYRDRCQEAGMDEHISKPITVSELLKVLARFASANRCGVNPVDGPSEKSRLQGTMPTDKGTFDYEALLERLGGDREALKEMMNLFSSHIPALVQDVRSAVIAEDWGRLAKLSHKLAGACATFGANALADVAREMERIAKSPQPMMPDGLLSRMDLELKALEQHIGKLRY